MTPPAPARSRTGPMGLMASLMDYVAMLAVLVLLVVVFGLLSERFLSLGTFRMITNQIPPLVIAAVGMTYVLIIAGIDLSVGSVLALGAAVLAACTAREQYAGLGLPAAVGIAACIGAGLVCGLANGFLTVAWRLPSFIVTLGMLEIARGATYLVTDSKTVYIGSDIAFIAETSLLGVSLPFLIAIAIVAAGQMVLSFTVFGRYMIAIGTNEEAVRLSGIDPRRVKLAVFALCGLLAAVAAVMETSRMESADPNMRTGFELQVIAAVVIGGTSLMGGRGSVMRSFLGALIIAVLGAGLAVIDVGEPHKRVITGAVIIAAAVLDYYRQRLKRTRQ
jgi:ribose transport system permease protein